MLTAEMVKEQARRLGADLVGISPMDRFEGAPMQQDPRYIFPAAKSCIVLGFRIPRGYMRGIEEGTYFAAYTSLGYGGLNQVFMPVVLRELSCFVEDHGYECAPVPNIYSGSSISFATQKEDKERSVPVAPGLPRPDILVDFRIAAYVAGLGEFGYSKVFLTPEFGPFQRFVVLLTDAPLEADPIFEGPLCDRCKKCVRACSGQAISATETEKITVAGHVIEFGKLDVQKCSTAYMGGTVDYNPFLTKDAKLDEMPETYHGSPKMGQWAGYGSHMGHNPALEGARGCMRECYVHLEERGRLKNKFVNKFRTHQPWRITPEMRAEHLTKDSKNNEFGE